MRILAGMILCLAAATAVAMPTIGIYAEESAEVCEVDIQGGENRQVWILVLLDSSEFSGGITAAEFRIDNLPAEGGYPLGVISPSWTSGVTVGDIFTDFSIAWTSPQYPPIVVVGSVVFQAFDANWIGDQHVMTVAEGGICGCIVVVDDFFQEHEAFGGRFTFNCDYDCGCGGFQSTASDWGQVKTLY